MLVAALTYWISYCFYTAKTRYFFDEYNSLHENLKSSELYRKDAWRVFPRNYILFTIHEICTCWIIILLTICEMPSTVLFLFVGMMLGTMLIYLGLSTFVSDPNKDSGEWLFKKSFIIPGLLGIAVNAGLFVCLRSYLPEVALLQFSNKALFWIVFTMIIFFFFAMIDILLLINGHHTMKLNKDDYLLGAVKLLFDWFHIWYWVLYMFGKCSEGSIGA